MVGGYRPRTSVFASDRLLFLSDFTRSLYIAVPVAAESEEAATLLLILDTYFHATGNICQILRFVCHG